MTAFSRAICELRGGDVQSIAWVVTLLMIVPLANPNLSWLYKLSFISLTFLTLIKFSKKPCLNISSVFALALVLLFIHAGAIQLAIGWATIALLVGPGNRQIISIFHWRWCLSIYAISNLVFSGIVDAVLAFDLASSVVMADPFKRLSGLLGGPNIMGATSFILLLFNREFMTKKSIDLHGLFNQVLLATTLFFSGSKFTWIFFLIFLLIINYRLFLLALVIFLMARSHYIQRIFFLFSTEGLELLSYGLIDDRLSKYQHFIEILRNVRFENFWQYLVSVPSYDSELNENHHSGLINYFFQSGILGSLSLIGFVVKYFIVDANRRIFFGVYILIYSLLYSQVEHSSFFVFLLAVCLSCVRIRSS